MVPNVFKLQRHITLKITIVYVLVTRQEMKLKKQAGSVRPARVNLPRYTFPVLQPLSSQVEHFLSQEAQETTGGGRPCSFCRNALNQSNYTRQQILTFVQACKNLTRWYLLYIIRMDWSDSNCTGTRHWPLVPFKFLIYGRRDEALSSLPGQKSILHWKFDKAYFKKPFPGSKEMPFAPDTGVK